MKRIGCDIDGCLNLFHKNLTEIASKYYGLKLENDDLVDNMIIEAMGFITQEEKKYFFEKYRKETEDPIVFPGARSGLTRLRAENYDVYLITARTYDIGSLTENWLYKYDLPYKELLLNCGTKIDACKWKEIDIMIEDNPYNIEALLKGGVKVLMPVHGYNKHLQHKNLIHCKNWDEIYIHINKHFKG